MSLTITNQNTLARGVRKHAVSQVMHVGPLSLRFITLVIFAAVALFYLAQTTQSATNSYNIQALDQDRAKMRDEYNGLKVQEVRLKALGEIKQTTQSQGLVPVSQ